MALKLIRINGVINDVKWQYLFLYIQSADLLIKLDNFQFLMNIFDDNKKLMEKIILHYYT